MAEKAHTLERRLAIFKRRLCAPIDAASLTVFRVFFGAFMMWEVGRYFSNDWIAKYYIAPSFHFTYYGFGWVHPWPGDGMYWHFGALAFLAFLIFIGFCYRLAVALFFLGFSFVFLLDQTQYLNHFYLISLISFLLIFVPAHHAFSVDAWQKVTPMGETAPAWSLWMLRFQIGLVYFYGGIAKLNADWLRGEPMRMWLADRTDFPLLGAYFTREETVWLFTYSGLLIDLSAAPLLLWRRTRVFGALLLSAFHLLNDQLFTIGIFPWFMLVATTLFFPPDWPRQLLSRCNKQTTQPQPASKPIWFGSSNAVMALLGAYVLWQILTPLRHFLYPGNVNWTEEGHRFTWHMKLRDKRSTAAFTVSDEQGQKWTVNNLDYLTARQDAKMSGRPDMILQFAHHLARQFGQRGYKKVQVHAEVMSSLNGRRPQLLIDPTADLAAQPRTWRHTPWIMPLYGPLPTPGSPAHRTGTP